MLAVASVLPLRAQPPVRFEPSFLLPVDVAWTTTLDSGPRHGPAYDGTRAYLVLRNDSVVAVDLPTGEQLWTVEQQVDHPLAAGDGVVVAASGSRLMGWRGSDGSTLWSAAFESRIVAPPLWNTGWLVAATAAGEIVVLRGFDGKELWRRALDSEATVRPAIAGGRLFVPLVDGRIVVLALPTGSLIWERELPGRPQGILPLDAVFVGSTDNFLYRLALDDGAIDWFWRTGGDIVGTPTVDMERVYFNARDNVLRALDRRNGARRWRRSLPGRPTDGPIRVGSVVVVAGIAPTVELFDTDTGLPRGRYLVSSELAAMPHVVPEARPPAPHLVLVTGAGVVIGLAAAAGPPQYVPSLPPEPFLPQPDLLSLAEFVDWFPARKPGDAPSPSAILPLSGVVDRLPPQGPPVLSGPER